MPPASPPPLHPRRGEGELEYPICFSRAGEAFLNRDAARRVCLPRLGNDAVVVNRLGLGAAAAAARRGVCKVSAANEHTWAPSAIGRAEQRSGDRIRAGACLSVASLRPTPGGASSARYPAGARPLARLSFAYLFFGEAKKSKSANRPKPALASSPFLCLLSFGEAKESNSANRPKPVFKPLASRPKPALNTSPGAKNEQHHYRHFPSPH